MQGSPVAFLIPAIVGGLVALSTWLILGKQLPDLHTDSGHWGRFWAGTIGGLFCLTLFVLMATGAVTLPDASQ